MPAFRGVFSPDQLRDIARFVAGALAAKSK